MTADRPEQGATNRVVVIGFGMVAHAFVDKLVAYDEGKRYSITVLGEEPYLAYNRVGLTQYFNNRSIESLYMAPLEWYSSHGPGRLTFRTGVQGTRIDAEHKRISVFGDSPEIEYDLCVLVTGSAAKLPRFISESPRKAHTLGVFVYRTIKDLESIIAYGDKDQVNDAIVVGGGLLGLEAAKAVLDMPSIANVTITERNEWILSRQLDEQGGRMLLEKVRRLGVKVLTKSSARDLVVDRDEVEGNDVLTGLQLENGDIVACQMVIFAIGISPRDELASLSGLKTDIRGGIVVDDLLSTSALDVYAIGECASWKGTTYGLIAPGVEMADVLAFNLTQGREHKIRSFGSGGVDVSTKLKLMGVDVASFGDYFADRERPSSSNPISNGSRVQVAPAPRSDKQSENVKALTYHDPFSSVYKKYVFSGDGKKLLGGMLVGDTKDYTKLLMMCKNKKPLDIPPGQLILGVPRKEGEDEGADLEDSAQVCSCYNVSKKVLVDAVKAGCASMGDLKAKTKCGTGCGGCIPLATAIFNAEMKKSGQAVSNNLCPHFKYSRVDLFNIIKVKKLRTSSDVMKACGINAEAIGCEVCKPAIASILSSLYNEHILKPEHTQNQDTNDKYLANIQRDGTYSVVPRIAGGEITPAKLRRIGEVAEEFGLYTKITGGQRIDMFGARKADLPDIWEKLLEAGFETGSAYGKALRTVKSCVGTSWCRFGVGDSVAMAIDLENRYKGIRAPHKIKGGVSGCVRECAEAQSKDFGFIATDKGWNIYVAGNGGAKPRHATLLARDVPKSKAIRLIDRFLMFYLRTADRLMRTARWIEAMEGGIDYLKKVIIDDALGICDQLDHDMDELVGSYFDEWAAVVNDPERRKHFRQFANVGIDQLSVSKIPERGQMRPQSWPKDQNKLILRREDIPTPEAGWNWRRLCRMDDLRSSKSSKTSSAAVMYGGTQLAIFYVEGRGLYASQNMCPHKRAFVLSDGLLGDNSKGETYVSCPLHKRNFTLDGGKCLSDGEYGIITFNVKEEGGDVFVRLPEKDALDHVLATSKYAIGDAEHCPGIIQVEDISKNQTTPSNGALTSNQRTNAGTTCLSLIDW